LLEDFLPLSPGQFFRILTQVPVASLVLAAGLVVSTIAWRFTESKVEHEAQAKFSAILADARGTLHAQLRSYYDVMHGLQGLFLVTPHVSRDAFGSYVANLGLAHRPSGIRALSYSQFVPATAKAEFVSQVRADHSRGSKRFANFDVKPPGERPEYVVLTYTEPLEGNEAGLGLDLIADPARRAAIDGTRDTGLVSASGRATLVSLPLPDIWSVSLRLAVYRPGMPTDTPEQRRQAFTGVVSAVLLVRDMVNDIVWQDPARPLQLRVIDAGERNAPLDASAPEALLFDSAPQRASVASFRESVPLEVGERLWQLQFAAPKHYFLDATDSLAPLLVLLGGATISLLLFGLVRATAASSQHAEARRVAQELIEALPVPVFFKGTDGHYLGVNKAWENYFGIARNAFIGKTVHDLYPHDPETAGRLDASDQVLWKRPGTQTYETTLTTGDGAHHDAIFYKATYTRAGGGVAGLIGTIIDITERKQVEKRRAMEYAVTRVLAGSKTLAEAIPKIIETICATLNWHCGSRWTWDKDAGVLRCHETWGIDSPEISEFMAASANLVLQPGDLGEQGLVRRAYRSGRPVWIADLSRAPGFRRAELAAQANLHGAFCFPLMLGDEVLGVMDFFHRDAREPDAMLISAAQSIGSQIGQYIVRKQAEEDLQFVAKHDALTRLPNRIMFHDRLEIAVARAKRSGRRLAIMFIDMDRFKVINDTLGHDAGDALLREVARRLTRVLRASDTVARLGGDEFVVLIDEVADPVYLGTIAQKLIDAFVASFILAGNDYHITASIGISTFPDDAEDLPTLLKYADIAMYRAKEQGRNAFQFYSAQMNVHSIERLALESSLRRALERNELVLHYQPRIEIPGGRITGVEALVRWQHPEMGLVPPGKFIPLAEETGLIAPIGEWALVAACTQHRIWEQAGLSDLRVAVNLSPRQFVHGDLVKTVARVLAETGCDPRNLELEITEGMVMREPEHAVALLQQLKDMGIHIAMDDFGTGYSSLAYLKRFPIDSLKIDRSFVTDVPEDAGDVAINVAVIAMAHSLGLKVVAEGVETQEQLDFLRKQGCDEMQGYLFSKPLPVEQVTALLMKGRKSRVRAS
jgi:diguanylate cyclase (GGDEF)-like protein/PAS domain S-box-containing protein